LPWEGWIISFKMKKDLKKKERKRIKDLDSRQSKKKIISNNAAPVVPCNC
jgi:hypothetical protein